MPADSLLPVSVLMSVYDRPDLLPATIDSVLAQAGVEFELLIIDDGADEMVKEVLTRYRAKPCIRIIEQTNQGLTRALINGCSQAAHPLIARIDVGDVMHVQRLSRQAQLLSSNPHLGIVTSRVDITTEEGYFLYRIDPTAEVLDAGLRTDDPSALKTPFHASVMFRKSIYQQVGGYRSEFYFSQDLDLWARMIRCAGIAVLPEVLTTGVFSPGGLSGRFQHCQQSLRTLVAQANQLREQGQPDTSILAQADAIRPGGTGLDRRSSTDESIFPGLYFLAKCLDDNRSIYARQYWKRALAEQPLSLPGWFFLLRNYLFSRRYSNG